MKIQFDDFFLDDQCYVFERSGTPISLRPKVFDLLAHLVRHRERVVRREELVEAVWQRTTVGPGSLSGLVNELRQALGEDRREPSLIRTVHARGYQFVGQVNELPSRAPQDPRGSYGPSACVEGEQGTAEQRALIEYVSESGAQGILFDGMLGGDLPRGAGGAASALVEAAHEMGFEVHNLVAPDAMFASAARFSVELLRTMEITRGESAVASALPLPARVWFDSGRVEPVAGGVSLPSGGPPGGVVAMAEMISVLAARKPVVVTIESLAEADRLFAPEVVRFTNSLGGAPVLVVALLGDHEAASGIASKLRQVLCGNGGFLDGDANSISDLASFSAQSVGRSDHVRKEVGSTSSLVKLSGAAVEASHSGGGDSSHASAGLVKPGVRSVRRLRDATATGADR